MSIKLAFNTSSCPADWSLQAMVDYAQRAGFHGIELSAGHMEADATGGRPRGFDLDDADLDVVASCFVGRDVKIAGLKTCVRVDQRSKATVQAQMITLRRHLQQARRLGCRTLCIQGGERPRGEPLVRLFNRMGDRLNDIAAEAKAAGVSLMIENSGDLALSHDAWRLCELVSDIGVGCCWNPMASQRAGESQHAALPRIGQSLSMVRLCDFQRRGSESTDGTSDGSGRGSGGADLAPMGEGALELDVVIDRLLGLGFDRWLVVDIAGAAADHVAQDASWLDGAIAAITSRLSANDATTEAAAAKIAKAAAKSAPKPRPRRPIGA